MDYVYLIGFVAGLTCGLGSVAAILVVRHLLWHRPRPVMLNPKYDPRAITEHMSDDEFIEEFTGGKATRIRDSTLQYSIMEKLGEPNPSRVVATDAYTEFLTELRAWIRRSAVEFNTKQAAVMEALGVETGHGRKYVARIVYGARRPSPEAVEALMEKMDLPLAQRQRLVEALRTELKRPVAKSPGHISSGGYLPT